MSNHKTPRVHASKDGRPLCGRLEKYQSTDDETAVTCEFCLNLLAGVHGLGNLRSDVRPCGTAAAIRRHQRRGERIDETCRQAEKRRQADWWANRKQKGLAA